MGEVDIQFLSEYKNISSAFIITPNECSCQHLYEYYFAIWGILFYLRLTTWRSVPSIFAQSRIYSIRRRCSCIFRERCCVCDPLTTSTFRPVSLLFFLRLYFRRIGMFHLPLFRRDAHGCTWSTLLRPLSEQAPWVCHRLREDVVHAFLSLHLLARWPSLQRTRHRSHFAQRE